MSRLRGNGIGAFAIVLMAGSLSTGCRKNKTAAIPTVAAPSATGAQAPRPKRSRTAKAPIVQPGSVETAGVPQPSPRLSQMLSPSEQSRYNSLIDVSLGAAQASLRSLDGRQLTAEQQSHAREVQEFIRQANETRKVDLVAGKGLADKAQVLARDLAKIVK